eukprot:1090256-Amorphochlora_amoeboformis.AAC.1
MAERRPSEPEERPFQSPQEYLANMAHGYLSMTPLWFQNFITSSGTVYFLQVLLNECIPAPQAQWMSPCRAF